MESPGMQHLQVIVPAARAVYSDGVVALIAHSDEGNGRTTAADLRELTPGEIAISGFGKY